MSSRFLILLCSIVFLHSCNNIFYLPGFDFSLFSKTPVRELAIAVEKEDVEKILEILNDQSISIDYQEPKFGHTLLMLAVANNKVKSTEILLENGANPNMLSYNKSTNAMLIACNGFYSESCDTTILSKLISFKGDLNQTIVYEEDSLNGNRKVVQRLLNTAISSRKCLSFIKYMVNRGADINYFPNNDSTTGPITSSLFVDYLEVTNYLIIDVHAVIPSYIYKRPANLGYVGEPEQYLTITDLLNEQHYEKGTENSRFREEIINYLQSKNLK